MRSVENSTGLLWIHAGHGAHAWLAPGASPASSRIRTATSSKGGEHLAFAMPRAEFDEVFRRVREMEIPFGDSFQSVGNLKGPGDATGARGPGASLYFFDPNKHLIEIRHYE